MDLTSHHKTGNHHHKQQSSSELLSSAKIMAEAAKATLHHETGKMDNGRVAGAAGDLLNAACHYGKLDEKGFGQYVEKAETYLHQYHSSQSSTTTTTAAAAVSSTTSHSGGGHGHSESGYGDYLKMAEGFFKKH